MSVSNRLLPLSCACLLLCATDLRAGDWHYRLNAGIANAPRYSGANERATAPLLGGSITSPAGFFLDTSKGLGWAHEGDTFDLGVRVGASTARKDHRSGLEGSDRLDGMGSIKSRPQLGLDAAYHLGPLTLAANFEHALEQDKDKPDTGSAYNHLKLSLGMQLYKGRIGELMGSVNSQFGDGDYMRTWYGVSQAQAAGSQFRAHDTRGGLISRGGELSWSVPFDEHWRMATVLAADYLSDDAGDSPLVDKRLQTSLVTQMTYTF
ncbi:MipA/OmpV family protein [Pseudomonas putida]|nr:MipA/OmpV family protein [Pseudomonas putida]